MGGVGGDEGRRARHLTRLSPLRRTSEFSAGEMEWLQLNTALLAVGSQAVR